MRGMLIREAAVPKYGRSTRSCAHVEANRLGIRAKNFVVRRNECRRSVKGDSVDFSLGDLSTLSLETCDVAAMLKLFASLRIKGIFVSAKNSQNHRAPL